jgi:hypothetical protein
MSSPPMDLVEISIDNTIESNHDFDEESHSKIWESYNALSKRDKILFITFSIASAVFFVLTIVGAIVAIVHRFDYDLSIRNAGIIIFSVFGAAFFITVVPYLYFGFRHIDNIEDKKKNGETIEVVLE